MHPVVKITPGKNNGFKLVFPKLVSPKLKLWSNKLLCLFPDFRKLPGSPGTGSWGRKGSFQSLLITQTPAASWFQFPRGESRREPGRAGIFIHHTVWVALHVEAPSVLTFKNPILSCDLPLVLRRHLPCFGFLPIFPKLWWIILYSPITLA